MNPNATVSALPWYREPWPWLLMAGPALVVVAGLTTAWIAVTHEDGLVADDYYKRGLAINQELRRDSAAVSLDVKARIMFGDSAVRVFLSLPEPMPKRLALQLVHPTRATLDKRIVLEASPAGWYEGRFAGWGTGRWGVLLEDEARTWRLTGELKPDNTGSLELSARRQPE
jgi:uncharacterized protein